MLKFFEKLLLLFLWRYLDKQGRKKEREFFFSSLFDIGKKGLNIGSGGNVEQDGELFVMKHVAHRLKNESKQPVIFDVGANHGQYATELIKHFRDIDYTIYSFEPSAKSYAILQTNIAGNNRIHTFPFGFSNEEKEIKLFMAADNSAIASVYDRRLEHFDIAMDVQEVIRVTTLDTFCSQNNIGNIDFLKIDVEGHELEVFKGAAGMIKKGNIKYIQFEFGGCNIDSRTYFQDFFYLLRDKYYFYRIFRDGFSPITDYKEEFEVFNTVNFFLELKK